MAIRLSFRVRKRPQSIYEAIQRVAEPDFGVKPPYLQEYVEKVREELGEPQFYEKLSGEMKKWRQFNIIYPIGYGIFIHAYSPRDVSSGYHRYIVIEPPKPDPQTLAWVEERLAMMISGEFIPRSSEEKKKMLLYLIDRIFKGGNGSRMMPRLPRVGLGRGNGGNGAAAPKLSGVELDYLKYHLVREKVGVGILEPFLRDPYIEDISFSGLGNIFIVHKMFGPMESNLGFKSEEELDAFIIRLGEKIGKPISTARPVVDATLPDGSRINIVFGSDVSLRGSNFTIRRVAKTPISVTQLINWGTFDSRIAAYIWMMLREGMSMFVCGETASGKTTSLNAVSAFIRPNAKIVTIEDTAEVVLPHPNWTRELTRDTGSPESSVTMFDLLRAALRQRPNYIIVGEIRGAEGNIAFQAMQSVTGETPVLVRRGRGKPQLTAIARVVDEYFQEGEEGEVPSGGIETLTLTPEGKITWSPVTRVLRHVSRDLYRITYESGRGVVKATGSHSVFVLDIHEMKIVPKPVSELRKKDFLIAPNKGRQFRCDPDRGYEGYWEEWSRKISTPPGGLRARVVRRLAEIVEADLGVELDKSILDTRREDERLNAEEILQLRPLRWRKGSAWSIYKAEALVRLLSQVAESEIELVPVEGVERLEGEEEMVYDFSVPQTQLFMGGTIPIALHNTGHPVMATFHAANLDRLIQRLTNHPINVPKTNLDSLNLAWFQSAVYVKGFPARRVIEIDEIIGYDPASDAVAAVPVFTWDPVSDRFVFGGRGASYLLEEKIATMRGLPRSRIIEIYEELDLRKQYLDLLVEKRVFEYPRVFKAIIYADMVGLENAIRNLREGKVSF